MAALDTAPVVGAGGGLYVAPADTAPPTSIVTPAPASPWKYLGLIDEDGVSYMPLEEETEDMNVWQLAFPWDVVTTGQSSSLSANLAQWNRAVIEFVFGGGTWTDTTDTTTFTPPRLGETSNVAVLLVVKTSSGHDMGVYYKRAKVTEREEATFSKSEMATLGVTITMLGVEGSDPQLLLFDLTGMPASGALMATEVEGEETDEKSADEMEAAS
jgi:hypothetical protein